ncbi:hypothetical protein TNCV_2558571 [Trichonephila clavipes]|nr:hypothetical protein TNCV_2558571 [Trichonephila clavipes]
MIRFESVSLVEEKASKTMHRSPFERDEEFLGIIYTAFTMKRFPVISRASSLSSPPLIIQQNYRVTPCYFICSDDAPDSIVRRESEWR